MHSRNKGNSGSHPPLNAAKPTWVRHSEKEVELLVAKLAKEGKTASEIGLLLRDSYGVPSVKLVAGKTIRQILEEKNLAGELPEDLNALIRRSVILRKHLSTNKQDMGAKRGLQLTESKIKRLAKYYKQIGRLDPLWKYDPANIKLYL